MRTLIAAALVLLVASSWPADAAENVKIGAYVMRLNDLNPTTQSFAVDLWIWTHSSAASELHPIQTLRLQNVRSVSADPVGETTQDGIRWGYREFAATVNQEWDVRHFPFDHHTLKVRIEETQWDTDTLQYVPDRAESGIDPRVKVQGWRIERVRVETHPIRYATRFGDPSPGARNSTWSEAWVLIDIRRDGLGIFAKTVLVAYIAFVLMMLSFLMDASLFSSRIGLLIGCLFASVVNMRGSESVLGRTDDFTLVDKIHLLVAIFIFVSATTGLITRRLEASRARTVDRWTAVISFVLFVAANAMLIATSMGS